MSRHGHVLVLGAVASAALGCRSEPSRPAPPPLPPQPSFTELIGTSVAGMHMRYGAARRIQETIAWGDLETTKAEADLLAAIEEPDALPRWQPYFERLRESARAVAASTTLVDAARAAAELGNECSHCHADIGGWPALPKEVSPPASPYLGPQMRTHQWAAARMWDGLLAPDNGRWLDGAEALSLAPLVLAETDRTRLLRDRPDATVSLERDIGKIRGLAEHAMTPLTQRQRTELYSDLLATCAHCHSLVRDRPRP